MAVLFKRLTVIRFLTVPPSAVHGLPKHDGIPPSTGTDVQHGKVTSGIFPRTTLKKNAVTFSKRSPPRKPATANVRRTFPPKNVFSSYWWHSSKNVLSSFWWHSSQAHQTNFRCTTPVTNQHGHYSKISGRPQRLPPGYQYINPVHLRTSSNKMSFHGGNRARVSQVRANRFALQRIQYNSSMVAHTH